MNQFSFNLPASLSQARLTDLLCAVAPDTDLLRSCVEKAPTLPEYQSAKAYGSELETPTEPSLLNSHMPSVPNKISNKSSVTLVERRHEPNSATYIYVHPKYGALFAHLGEKSLTDQGLHERESNLSEGDFSSPFQSPLQSPLRSGFHDRTNSRTNSPSKLRDLTTQDDNGDLWLGANGLDDWQRKHERKNLQGQVLASHNRARCKLRFTMRNLTLMSYAAASELRLPRPTLSSRSNSASNSISDSGRRAGFSKLVEMA